MSQEYSYPADDYILIGTVIKAQGMRGEVAIHCFSGQPENIGSYHTLVLVDREGTLSPELAVQRFRLQASKAVVQFDRVGDRTFAEKLVGMGVLLPRADLPQAGTGEYYWRQLIGLPVTTMDGRYLGVVCSLFSNGAQDIMEIEANGGQYLVPVTEAIIASQSDTGIVIDPPPGLLEMNDSTD